MWIVCRADNSHKMSKLTFFRADNSHKMSKLTFFEKKSECHLLQTLLKGSLRDVTVSAVLGLLFRVPLFQNLFINDKVMRKTQAQLNLNLTFKSTKAGCYMWYMVMLCSTFLSTYSKIPLSITRFLQKVLSLDSDYFSATFYQTYFYYKPSKYSPFTETHFCNLFTQSRKADWYLLETLINSTAKRTSRCILISRKHFLKPWK